MKAKLFALAFATTAVLATVAGGVVVADDASPVRNVSPDNKARDHPAAPDVDPSVPDRAGSSSADPSETSDESFPETIRTVVYESGESPTVTFVTDDDKFALEPTVVGFSDTGERVPRRIDFTPMFQVGLDGDALQSADETNGTRTIEVPDDAEREPVAEYDPDVPVSAVPEELRYDPATHTLTVVTTDGTYTLEPSVVAVTDDGTVEYRFQELSTESVSVSDAETDDGTIRFETNSSR